MADASLKLFEAYQDDADGISAAAFLAFVAKYDLLDKRLTREDAQLIYTKVKLSNKKALSLERFQEALRQMAVKKKITLDELLNSSHTKDSEAEIFENERYRPGVGWSCKYLLGTDRKNFSDRPGKKCASKFTQLAQQLGINMVANWEIDRTWVRCDNDGWSYARDFKSFNWHLKKGRSKSKPKMLYFVRRRRWINSKPTASDNTQVRRVDEVLQQMQMLEDRFQEKQTLVEKQWEGQKKQRAFEIEAITKRKELIVGEMNNLKEEIVLMQQKKGTLNFDKSSDKKRRNSVKRSSPQVAGAADKNGEDDPEQKLDRAKDRNTELVSERDRLQAQLLMLKMNDAFPPKDDNIRFPVDGAAAAFIRIGELWVESIR
jgi:hypothetical protein